MSKNRKISVSESTITVILQNDTDYISLTDMTTSFREGSGLIGKWITNKNTLEYLGVWEKINNSDFNYPEFGVIAQEAGTNRFVMSVGQWLERTKAVGMIVKAGRYGGTYAHKDIAFHFAMCLSPEYQIYLVNVFRVLPEMSIIMDLHYFNPVNSSEFRVLAEFVSRSDREIKPEIRI